MTDFIVKCAAIDQYRQSTSIWIGNYRTKLQRMNGQWNPDTMMGGAVMPWDLSSAAVTGEDHSTDLEFMSGGYHAPGTQGIWIWDDTIHDRIPLWRPQFTVDVERVALIVTSAIAADTDEYYNFKILNGADDTIVAYTYTSATGISAESPTEMTVVSTANTITRSQALILQIEDECAKAPITGLTVVIDYEPSGS